MRTEAEVKRSVVDAFIRTGAITRLYIDPRPADVHVPEEHKASEWLVLDVGTILPTPIHDLYWFGAGVQGTMSFGGRKSYVFVPWHAIKGVRNQATDELVTWVSGATAVACEESPQTERLPPKTDAKVIDLVAWRRARGR